jgi:hypothetical protein
MLQKMYTAFKSSIKMQYIIALTIMWGAGLVICIYLIDFTTQKNIFKELDFIGITDKTPSPLNIAGSEAYVFVNVNKKHFLTRFVAAVTDKGDSSIKKSYTALPLSVVEKVIKKTVPVPIKKNVDFTIKPVPEL